MAAGIAMAIMTMGIPTTTPMIMDITTTATIDAQALGRLLRLASPMLPVGAYSYSGGLEAAIESGIVHDPASTEAWVQDVLELYLARFELPILWRMQRAWAGGEAPVDWNDRFRAGRDTAESLAETLQMGGSLVSLLTDLGEFPAEALARLKAIRPVTFLLAYAFAAAHWVIPAEAACQAYTWSWAENQVAAAMKAVPIGQVAGQRILAAVSAAIPPIVARAASLGDEDISNFAPGLTLAAIRHETQYSRLFRS
jgi:urease accessory protein